jgi:DNA ligase-1
MRPDEQPEASVAGCNARYASWAPAQPAEPSQGLAWFALLLEQLDASNAQSHKLEVLRSRFAALSDHAQAGMCRQGLHDDLAWVVYFLCGGKLPRAIRSSTLREAALQASGLAPWLFEACYAHAGDLAETIACCLPVNPAGGSPPTPAQSVEQFPNHREQSSAHAGHDGEGGCHGALHGWLHAEVIPATRASAEQQVAWLIDQWSTQRRHERFAMNKLLTGGFRLGISRALVLRALSQAAQVDARDLAQRFMGWMEQLPSGTRLRALFDGSEGVHSARPLPFCLANSHDGDPAPMGRVRDWQIEWKWDGIRVQWIKSGNAVFLWSRGEELISEQFPDVALSAAHQGIADQTVLDGELVAWEVQGDRPASFAALQKRLHRKRLNARLIAQYPVRMLVYDLLVLAGEDLRERSLAQRREALESLARQEAGVMQLSPVLEAENWESVRALREEARAMDAEGLMLKHRASAYRGGRGKVFASGGERAGWWKWKLDPFRIDAVLVYAQAGHGRRANLFSDYTFAVRGPLGWLTVAKAYSGLSDAEIREVDARIRKTTLEHYGPVRAVEPTMVFELGFEAIQESSRHRSGVALRFPRMLRWRKDKAVDQADRIEDLRALLRGPADARP